MCPPSPISALLDFKACSTDEEYVQFLGAMKVGDPIPENVFIDVNPFRIESWNSPENRWYLYSSEDQQGESGENYIIGTKSGYWKPIGAHRISTGSHTVGKKTTLEFFEGQAPCGTKSGWMMHKYQAEQEVTGFNTTQNYYCLSRVFLQSGENPNSEQQDTHVNADLDCDQLGSYWPCLAEQEENSFLPQEAIDKTQMVVGDQQKVNDSKRLDELTTGNSAGDMITSYDFSGEDYLELNDLLSRDSSSTSSDNSSKSDEFDGDALLRDLLDENSLSTEEVEHTDCWLSIFASVQSNQVVMWPPEPGLVGMPGNSVPDGPQDSHPAVSMPASGLQHNKGASHCAGSQNSQLKRTLSENSQDSKSLLPTTGLQHNKGASLSASLQNSQVNRILPKTSQDSKFPLPTTGVQHNKGASPSTSSQNSRANRSESSQATKSPRGHGTSSVGKIAKLGKKYFCFASF